MERYYCGLALAVIHGLVDGIKYGVCPNNFVISCNANAYFNQAILLNL